MKKKIATALVMALVSSTLFACGSATENNGAASDASVQDSSIDSNEISSSAAEVSTESAFTTDFDNLETISLKDIKAADYVTLGEYTGVSVEASLKEVTDADVEDYINNLKSSNPPMTEVTDRAVQEGDTVNIDYVGKYADTKEAFDGGTASGADLKIGSNSYIEGFESGLVGAEIGETRDLDLTFPEDYGATNLAGKAVVFTVTVNSIKVEADELTDEWAAGLGREGVSNLEELRTYANKTLEDSNKSTYDQTVENKVLTKATENSTFSEIPEKLVNRYMQQQYQMLQYRASMFSMYYGQQLSVSDVVNMYMQNEGYEGTADDYIKEISEDMAKQYVMFQAIADEQGIEVSEKEIDDYLKEAYESASSTAFSSFDEYKASLDMEVYREGLMAEKIVKYLVDNANVAASESSEEASDAASDASSTVAE